MDICEEEDGDHEEVHNERTRRRGSCRRPAVHLGRGGPEKALRGG